MTTAALIFHQFKYRKMLLKHLFDINSLLVQTTDSIFTHSSHASQEYLLFLQQQELRMERILANLVQMYMSHSFYWIYVQSQDPWKDFFRSNPKSAQRLSKGMMKLHKLYCDLSSQFYWMQFTQLLANPVR